MIIIIIIIIIVMPYNGTEHLLLLGNLSALSGKYLL
jgi:hypothetical protein